MDITVHVEIRGASFALINGAGLETVGNPFAGMTADEIRAKLWASVPTIGLPGERETTQDAGPWRAVIRVVVSNTEFSSIGGPDLEIDAITLHGVRVVENGEPVPSLWLSVAWRQTLRQPVDLSDVDQRVLLEEALGDCVCVMVDIPKDDLRITADVRDGLEPVVEAWFDDLPPLTFKLAAV